MAKWSVGSETGILRKPISNENFDDLLVFGYACKIFRDDEKAQYIDQGKHLIPWMGDSTLKIDRYDCRGALSELAPYEGTLDHEASHWLGLSESERRLEMLCDEERYYALKHNEDELEMYQEEETKRLLQKGTEFQYNYDVPENPDQPEQTAEIADQDEIFVPAPELNIPADMEVPKTVKENARIEKTASFVSNQGPQMEILIKTKQADNPQFNFMNKDNPLYKYYKFILTAIKSGQYKIPSETTAADQKAEAAHEQEDHDDHYLHPCLVATTANSAQLPPLPTVTYKPSADCAYSQLVSRIQGTQSESATPPPPLPAQEAPQSQMTYEQQQYYQQYYYAAQYYEYYKQMAQQFAGQNSTQSSTNAMQDMGITPEQFYSFCQNHMEFQNLVQSQTVYQQYVQQQPSNPYAQLVSNLSQSQGKDAYAGVIPSITNINDIAKAPVLYTQPESEPHLPATAIPEPSLTKVQDSLLDNHNKTNESAVKMPLLSLAQYGSDSEEDESDGQSNIKIPPYDLQQIIDKMAVYVSKNGRDFENIVKAKGDPRFQFLNPDHEFNPYYKMKMGENTKTVAKLNGIPDKPKEKKVIAPVSFSIKKPKEEIPKEIKSALPVEESDDEQETTEVVKTPPVVGPASPTLVLPVSAPPPPLPEASQTNLIETSCLTPNTQTSEDGNINKEIPESAAIVKDLDSEDLIMEMIDITDDLEERRENKRAENIKKDKITAAVRERLALQLERKKKAAAFLKLKTSCENDKGTEVVLKEVPKVTKHNKIVSNATSKSSTSSRDVKLADKCRRLKDDIRKLKKVIAISKNDPSILLNTSNKAPDEMKEIKPQEQIVEIINIEDSDLEEGEIKKHKKSKRKKSHKRKHSKCRHESKHRHKSKEHKKSKKRRKKSETRDSDSSLTS